MGGWWDGLAGRAVSLKVVKSGQGWMDGTAFGAGGDPPPVKDKNYDYAWVLLVFPRF